MRTNTKTICWLWWFNIQSVSNQRNKKKCFVNFEMRNWFRWFIAPCAVDGHYAKSINLRGLVVMGNIVWTSSKKIQQLNRWRICVTMLHYEISFFCTSSNQSSEAYCITEHVERITKIICHVTSSIFSRCTLHICGNHFWTTIDNDVFMVHNKPFFTSICCNHLIIIYFVFKYNNRTFLCYQDHWPVIEQHFS